VAEKLIIFLAAAALAEGAEVADAPHQQVVDALLNTARTENWWWGPGDAFSALGWLVGDGYASAELLALARDETMEAPVREQAAKTLLKLGQATPEVLAGLRVLVEEPKTPERVRQAARGALWWLEG
jgi:hypothetical protein